MSWSGAIIQMLECVTSAFPYHSFWALLGSSDARISFCLEWKSLKFLHGDKRDHSADLLGRIDIKILYEAPVQKRLSLKGAEKLLVVEEAVCKNPIRAAFDELVVLANILILLAILAQEVLAAVFEKSWNAAVKEMHTIAHCAAILRIRTVYCA